LSPIGHENKLNLYVNYSWLCDTWDNTPRF
jgi:hypothetical protein